MSATAPPLDETTVKFGLLMESAQAHQHLAETHLEKLRAHVQDLDGVVREEIRRTLVEELQALTAETHGATQALRSMKRSASLRHGLWMLSLTAFCTAVPAAVLHYVLPSPAELTQLRAQRDRLAVEIARLEQQGGRVQWHRCGEAGRLCARIDRHAPAYGEHGDYYVLEGY
jgi:hypothetical protein